MPVNVLSGGERRRVALCKLLLEAPDLLLLDEPTNHLDAESVLWLEQFLRTYPGAVLAVTHDRYFLDNVAEWIAAGAVAVGAGGSLTAGAKTGDYGKITETARQFVEKIRAARGQ